MYCKSCGYKLADDSKFCPKCGSKIEIEENKEIINEKDVIVFVDDNGKPIEKKEIKLTEKQIKLYDNLAISSFILAIISLACSFIPFVNFCAFIFGSIAISLSAIATNSKSKKIFWILGLAISALSMLIAFIFISFN